jgi:hypothetical protein
MGRDACLLACLPVATFHLSVLIERIILALLGTPVASTEVAVLEMGRDSWFDAKYVLEERRKILSDPDWV